MHMSTSTTSLNNIVDMSPLPQDDLLSTNGDPAVTATMTVDNSKGLPKSNVIMYGSTDEKYQEYVKRIFRWSVYRNYYGAAAGGGSND